MKPQYGYYSTLCCAIFLIKPLLAFPPHLFHQTPSQHYHLYMWGYYNNLKGNYPIAQQCYDLIFQTEGSVYAYNGYVHFLNATGNYQKIVALIPQVDLFFRDNIDLQILVIKALEHVGNQQEADKKVLALINEKSTNPELIYYATLAYIRNNLSPKALILLDRYIQKSPSKPTNFIFYYLKAQIYLNNYQKDLALSDIRKCLELNPAFEQGWLLSGLIHELEGKIDEALVGYHTFLQLVGHDQAVEQQILKLNLKRTLIHPTQTHNSFEEALALYKLKEYEQALKLVNNELQNHEQDQSFRLLKVELLCALKKYTNALTLLSAWIEKEPTSDIWLRALHLLYLTGIEQATIYTLIQKIAENHATILLPTLYAADLHIKNKSLNKAIAALERAYALTDNTLLQEKILYQKAVLFADSKKHQQLSSTLLQAEKLPLSFAPLFNILAYYYTTKGADLIKAQNYINSALLNDTRNTHFLDTQALIWYKQKEYSKAVGLLRTLTEQTQTDFFILKHLGKTLSKMGHQQEALIILNKALNCSPDNEKETCQKLIKNLSR